MVTHDAGSRAIANVLKGLQQDRSCHIAAEIAHKDVKVGGFVALLILEGQLDAHFLWEEAREKVWLKEEGDGKQTVSQNGTQLTSTGMQQGTRGPKAVCAWEAHQSK